MCIKGIGQKRKALGSKAQGLINIDSNVTCVPITRLPCAEPFLLLSLSSNTVPSYNLAIHSLFPRFSKSSSSTLMDRNVDENRQGVLASMFVGTTIAFILHGVTCCQVIWYFRFQAGRSSKRMKLFILLIWLGETLDCVLMLCTTAHTLLGPAIARARLGLDPCRYWGGVAQKMASEMCTISIEGFFILRMWRFSEKKKLTAVAFIPYIIGSVIAFAQLIYGIRILCNPSVKSSNQVLVFLSFSCKLFADGITVLTMCYMLYVRSSGFPRHTNTIKIVRGVILWIISTGVLTWLSGVLMLACYMHIGKLPNSAGIYYVRSGLYVNAMLAQLNARPRFQAMADATILHSINLDTMSPGRRVNPHPRQGNGSVLNPSFR